MGKTLGRVAVSFVMTTVAVVAALFVVRHVGPLQKLAGVAPAKKQLLPNRSQAAA